MAKIEVKINGVNTLVDVDKLEKLENSLFADNYKEDGSVDVDVENEQVNVQRVQEIKAKAGELINSKYTIYWQLNHPRVDEKYSAEYQWIDGIREISNKAEIDGTKVEDIKWQL